MKLIQSKITILKVCTHKKKKSENERKKELIIYSGNQCRCKEVKRGGGDSHELKLVSIWCGRLAAMVDGTKCLVLQLGGLVDAVSPGGSGVHPLENV